MMDENVPIKKFHWMNLCIKCDKGNGKLLNCRENDCPLVIHEGCLGCEAKFDEVGNFTCPYCVYKRAFQDFSQAQRKVVFAEKNLYKYLNGKGVAVGGVEMVNVSGSSDVRDQGVERGPECSMRDEGADVFLVNNEGVVLLHKVGDDGGLNDEFDRVEVVEKESDECCSGEGNVYQEKDVDMNKRSHSEDTIQNDATRTESFPEYHQDAGKDVDMNKRSHSEDTIQNDATRTESFPKYHQDAGKDVDMNKRSHSEDTIQNDATRTESFPEYHQDAGHYEAQDFIEENLEEAEENEGRMDEVKNQEQAHKTIEKTVCKESVPEVHVEAKRRVNETTASTCMDTDTISEEVNGAQPPGVDVPKGLSRKSSKVAKAPAILKLPTPKLKRKRSAWKVEEEDKLKEGVQKYSKVVNKNIPWQKILEDGRDVFDETRTPADLKDKWRNILSKEPLFGLS